MPVYPFRCLDCGREWEEELRISEPDPPCEKTHGVHKGVERLIASTSFSLVGSGWYKDGYASKKP